MIRELSSKTWRLLKSQATAANFFGLATVALLIIINFDTLAGRYEAFSKWASEALLPFLAVIAQALAFAIVLALFMFLGWATAGVVDFIREVRASLGKVIALEKEIAALRIEIEGLRDTASRDVMLPKPEDRS